jgi:hypothetical protein
MRAEPIASDCLSGELSFPGNLRFFGPQTKEKAFANHILVLCARFSAGLNPMIGESKWRVSCSLFGRFKGAF